ncbi:hypothetical protein K502DRAFT_361670 [Neoconidiobolus thromboides FSU 785]|nr:hypothetical protein K502DRAFT_361670 [Neoconidiobolus thromboides FSU 785]
MGQIISCIQPKDESKPLKSNVKISKALIGSPSNFQHLAHGGSDGMVMNYGTSGSQLKSLKKDMEEFAKLLDDIDINPKTNSEESAGESKGESIKDKEVSSLRDSLFNPEVSLGNHQSLNDSLAEIFNLPPPSSSPKLDENRKSTFSSNNENFFLAPDNNTSTETPLNNQEIKPTINDEKKENERKDAVKEGERKEDVSVKTQ